MGILKCKEEPILIEIVYSDEEMQSQSNFETKRNRTSRCDQVLLPSASIRMLKSIACKVGR